MSQHKGRIILVGAGPGDAGLITVRGAAALAAAQTVVYDRLVSDAVLDLIPESAEQIFVGKESGHHPVPQDEINNILLQKSLEGKTVVRLKGGDPFLFGRGGEELELPRQNGIDFEVVPGVTSAFAAPAYAGIPVTHRDYCSSVHIITGHAKKNGELSIDFDALVKAGGTYIFMMSVSSLGTVLNGLINAGLPPETPAATVENGTSPNQRKTVATAGTLEALASERGVMSPAVLIVGGVCELSEQFDWFDKLPLKGLRVLVTRPRDSVGTLASRLSALGAEAVAYPCIETSVIDSNTAAEAALLSISQYKWLVLTSPRGVKALSDLLAKLKKDTRALAPVKIAAIGAATASALASLGISADYVPASFDAAHLASGLCELVHKDEKILILRAREGTKELCAALDGAGLRYDDIAVYETYYRGAKSAKIAKLLQNAELDYVCFTSASTVRGFTGSLAGASFGAVNAVCIGRSTAAEAKKHGMRTLIAKNATMDDMIETIISDRGTQL